MQETMEERVRRLRAAHLAAKQHNVSKMDQVIGGSRRLFDAAHKFTVMGLIGFSGMSILSIHIVFLRYSVPWAGFGSGWFKTEERRGRGGDRYDELQPMHTNRLLANLTSIAPNASAFTHAS